MIFMKPYVINLKVNSTVHSSSNGKIQLPRKPHSMVLCFKMLQNVIPGSLREMILSERFQIVFKKLLCYELIKRVLHLFLRL